MSDALDACDSLMRSLGAEILSLDVAKRAAISDLPDRRYFYRSTAIWFEVKAGPNKEAKSLGDKLSRGQLAFLDREHRYDAVAGAGDAEALKRIVVGHAPSEWRSAAWAEVAVILLRGFRGEKKQRATRKSGPRFRR